MSDRHYDPFEAWQNYLNEDLDVSKLHKPEDFIKEVGEFIKETSANLKALQDIAHHHDTARTNPRLGEALDSVIEAIEVLRKEHAQVKIPQESMAGAGKTFKKV
jgi:hypothetical protein